MKPTISQLLDDYRAGRTTVRAAVESSLAAIDADRAQGADGLNAVVSIHDRSDLLAQADAADERWEQIRAARTDRGSSSTSQVPPPAGGAHSTSEEDENRGVVTARPLESVPVIVKDNICVRGELVTAASKILAGYRSAYSATVTTKLKNAGAIILGNGNMDEFAMGSSGEHSAYGPTKHPIDRSRVPGGSSSGPAASVAAGFVPLSFGSDTGGSIRVPASFCGLVGLKPTYGRVSRHGLLALASSLDQIGPFTHTVADAARAFEVIVGRDPMDQTTRTFGDDLTGLTETVVSRTSSTSGESEPTPEEIPALRHLRIGSFDGPANLEGLDAGVRQLITNRREQFLSQLTIDDLVDFNQLVDTAAAAEFLDLALDVYYITLPAEVSSNLARYDGIRFGKRRTANGERPGAQTLLDQYLETRSAGFGAETKRRIMLGTYVLSSGYYDAYYKTALKARAYVEQVFERVFESVNILMGPSVATPAFKLGERIDDPLAMYLSDLYAIPANIGGLCAISVPCGTVSGLPVGMQLIAKGGDERRLLQVASAFERWNQESGIRNQE